MRHKRALQKDEKGFISSETNLNGVDLVKFICAFLVCIIHIDPFPETLFSSAKYLNFGLQQYICRLAVPFFFVSAGFFLFRKMDLQNLDVDKIRNYCFKILRFIGTWSLLLFMGGTQQLWYLGGTVVAVILLSVLLHRHVKLGYIIALACVLYVIGLLGDSYYGIFEPLKSVNIFGHISNVYVTLFRRTRNGVFMGFIYTLIGMLFAQKKIVMNFKVALAGFIGSMVLLFAEVFTLNHFGIPKDYNMYLFLLPATFFLFYLASNIKLKSSGIYVKLRVIGVLVYFLHMLANICVLYLNAAVGSLAGLDLSAFVFIETIIAVTALAVLIEYLSHKEKFKWLQWLYV